ncbi:uncharacterized protein SETTUDRAFT_34344 [Exserohilum turcica Et28A]|uniref:Uncharacterized protein n=1 Tax=Exserohilum turcicum (strain 28A) TaxID=671987 RepID=R0IC72_EXST2|nr:uncharacterized protein SETTUDRAFT_34344 [Exserohilum turcica Et28A]EOA82816.1 hypothetical protein SETTUDRAFT_34344 [Exserohilum turcica Et28A]
MSHKGPGTQTYLDAPKELAKAEVKKKELSATSVLGGLIIPTLYQVLSFSPPPLQPETAASQQAKKKYAPSMLQHMDRFSPGCFTTTPCIHHYTYNHAALNPPTPPVTRARPSVVHRHNTPAHKTRGLGNDAYQGPISPEKETKQASKNAARGGCGQDAPSAASYTWHIRRLACSAVAVGLFVPCKERRQRAADDADDDDADGADDDDDATYHCH